MTIKMFALLWTAQLLQSYFLACTGFEFDRNYFGVSFTPVITEKQSWDDRDTFRVIHTMMELISTRFSKILTKEHVYRPLRVGHEYIHNHTYYNENFSSIYNGEAAAVVNRERNATSLSLIIGVRYFPISLQLKKEALLAFESAEKANSIFSNTVHGISFPLGQPQRDGQLIVKLIKEFQRNSAQLGVELGVTVSCDNYLNSTNNTIITLEKDVVREVDFVICESKSAWDKSDDNPSIRLEKISNSFLIMRNALAKVNSNVTFIGNTHWKYSDVEEWQTVSKQKEFWEIASEWAAKNQITVIMDHAIDRPSGRNGWWLHRKGSSMKFVNNYYEKISVIPPKLDVTTTKANTDHGVASQSSSMTSPNVTEETTVAESPSGPQKSNDMTEPNVNQLIVSTDPIISGRNTSTGVTVWLGISGGGAILIILICSVVMQVTVLNKSDENLDSNGIQLYEFFRGADIQTSQQDVTEPLIQNALSNPYDRSYEISADNLHIENDKLLGKRQFGCVFQARLKCNEGEIDVALKMVRRGAGRSAVNSILAEIKILTFLGHHENIVALKGAYTAELANGIVYLATELCGLGSLESYLRKSCFFTEGPEPYIRSDRFDSISSLVKIGFDDMIQWAKEIACGMEYLGTKDVVHVDLATRNVLLTEDKTAKIADFGLSRRMYNRINYVKKGVDYLPWRWMAIESLKRSEFSVKSDVWGYGVTLWEIFSMGDTPYPNVRYSAQFLSKLLNGSRLECPEFSSKEVYKLMAECWCADPLERPSFGDVIKRVEEIGAHRLQ